MVFKRILNDKFILLIFLCLFLYFFGITSIPLTDPDETFYAETAKEMIGHHSLLTPLIFEKPQFEKPPLFYWLIAGSLSVFRTNPFAARAVSAISGIAGIIAVYFFIRRLMNEKIAFNSSIVLATSLLYLVISKIVLTDICFTLFVTLSTLSFFAWFKLSGKNFLYLFGLFSGLAVLTKGPLGLCCRCSPDCFVFVCQVSRKR